MEKEGISPATLVHASWSFRSHFLGSLYITVLLHLFICVNIASSTTADWRLTTHLRLVTIISSSLTIPASRIDHTGSSSVGTTERTNLVNLLELLLLLALQREK